MDERGEDSGSWVKMDLENGKRREEQGEGKNREDEKEEDEDFHVEGNCRCG